MSYKLLEILLLFEFKVKILLCKWFQRRTCHLLQCDR